MRAPAIRSDSGGARRQAGRSWIATYAKQVKFILIDGSLEEFSLGYLLLGVIPLLFFRRFQPRERAWLLCLVAFYFVLGPFLLELFNPAPDRQSLSLNKPFFIASHVFLTIGIGYGLTLLLATLVAQYEKYRLPVMIGLAVVAGGALWFGVAQTYQATPYWVLRLASVWAFAIALLAALALVAARQRAPIAALLAVALLMPGWTRIFLSKTKFFHFI